MSPAATQNQYMRFVLDAHFAHRVRDDAAFVESIGMDADTHARLLGIDEEALEVERRGRITSLLVRVRTQLRATAAFLEHHLPPPTWWALVADYFGSTFWDFDQTLALHPYGKGWEMASTFAAFVQGEARRPESTCAITRVAAEIAAYEHALFVARHFSESNPPRSLEGAADHDLFALIHDHRPPPDEVALAQAMRWRVDETGSTHLVLDGESFGSSASGAASAHPSAIEVSPDVMVRLESYRLNHYHTSSTLYFPLGARSEELNAAHAEFRAKPGECHHDLFVKTGAGYALREEDYFVSTPDLFVDDDVCLVFERRDQREKISVPMTPERLGAFGALLSSIGPAHHWPTARAALSDDMASFADQLLGHGFLCPSPWRSKTARVAQPRVTLVGHSAVLFETQSTRVLLDPFLVVRHRPEFNPLRDVLARRLDAVVISHPHWDHLNFDSLLHLHRDTTVIVPRHHHRASIVNVEMAKMVRSLGFTNVVEVDAWESIDVGGEGPAKISVTALPYFGETTGSLSPRDWMTVQVTVGGRRAVCLVDACSDSFGNTDAMLETVVDKFGSPDLLLAPSAGFRYPLHNYTRRPFFIGAADEPYTGGPRDAARWQALTAAKVLIPYAMFHLTSSDVDLDAERAARDSFRDGGVATLAGRVKAAPDGPLCIMRPSDWITWGEGETKGIPLVDGMRLVRKSR